ncbi:TIGR03617 family F420-dependent LLM class oxidoreductase [Streptomyces sp. NPDC055078]
MTQDPTVPLPALRTDIVHDGPPEGVADAAARAEALGAHGLFLTETAHDAFIGLGLAARATERVQVGTSVAIAFARTPMTLAQSAFDIQRLSGGRAVIGLGSQIKPHITRRYSMPWSRPAARMREFVLATRAIWHSWQTGERLAFTGDFYTHNLMTPMFDPGPVPEGPPPVWIAGVGPLMTATAGEVADGLICHALTSADYLREVTLPAVREGRAKAEAAGEPWTSRPFDVSGCVMVATGRTEEEYERSVRAMRERIAFYGSTPAYLGVLEQHGWGELHTDLNTFSKQGRWEEMGRLIDDETLNTFSVCGEPAAVGRAVRERFAGLLTRVSVMLPHQADDDIAFEVLHAIR